MKPEMSVCHRMRSRIIFRAALIPGNEAPASQGNSALLSQVHFVCRGIASVAWRGSVL